MKVTDASQIKGLGPSASSDAPRPEAPGRAASDRVSTDESIRLAKVIAEATQSAGASRAAKLEAIEAAVRQGTYRPDPQRIAQEILDDAELAARLQALFER